MTTAWTLAVARDDLAHTTLREVEAPEPGDGEAVLRVDRVGLTANNVTYAVLGESLRYWEFFPTEPGLGLVPLWGFAEVVSSRADGVEVGTRVYGYLPPASHLLVRPERVNHDDSAGAHVLALSSASSKAAYATAFLLRGGDREVVGLTSAGNVAFTESLGCYDRVLAYDDVTQLAGVPTAYVDLAGSSDLRRALHDHLAEHLVLDLVVGVTHQDSSPAGTLAGARPQVFFAPDRMRTRTADWGRDGLGDRFAQAWRRFVPVVEGWVDVTVGQGPEGLRAAWLEVLSGRSDPRTGHVVQL